MRHVALRIHRAVAMLMLATGCGAAFAVPRIPVDAGEVLAELSARWQAPVAAGQPPLSRDQALDQARLLFERARQEGDPRFLGYAEALLQPWTSRADMPPEVRLMRARLRQYNHRFGDALADIRQVLAADPHNAEAWLLLATVDQVRADFPAARDACRHLRSFGTLPIALVCEAQVDSLTGRRRDALATLQRLSPIAATFAPDQQHWFELAWADMLARDGRTAQAVALLQQQDLSHSETLAAWADLRLAEGRYRDVVARLTPYRQQDGLLLRLAFAQQQLGAPEAAASVAMLAERFAALRQRGERSHLREEAWFELKLRHRPDQALTLARANWQQQREPADWRVYREAALAVRSATDLHHLARWQQLTGMESPS